MNFFKFLSIILAMIFFMLTFVVPEEDCIHVISFLLSSLWASIAFMIDKEISNK